MNKPNLDLFKLKGTRVKDIVMLVIFIGIVVFTTLGYDARRVAKELAKPERAELTLYFLIIAASVYFILRFIAFIKSKGLVDGIISVIYLILVLAGFISGYNPKIISEELASKPGMAESIFFVIIVAIIVAMGLWMIGSIYGYILKSKNINT